MMIPVRFIRGHMSYGVGELAGFAQGEARRLIERGIVEPVEAPAEVEAQAAPAEVEAAPRKRGRPRKS